MERRAVTVGVVRELLVMRHGKSDWSTDDEDFERPLAKRGRQDARRMAEWLVEHDLEPDQILTSTATRARMTVQPVIDAFDIADDRVHARDSLYLANAWTWLGALEEAPQGRVLFCGHNPGLDDLVEYLSADTLPLTFDGKLMTTAAIARFGFDEEWSGIGRGSGELLALVRPRQL
ncbi:MAG: histidine phosphatase family protein [Acidimicrobiia bacterium]|nr:histidine phosphatase family protein [Acidimicrobiia bacterium]